MNSDITDAAQEPEREGQKPLQLGRVTFLNPAPDYYPITATRHHVTNNGIIPVTPAAEQEEETLTCCDCHTQNTSQPQTRRERIENLVIFNLIPITMLILAIATLERLTQ